MVENIVWNCTDLLTHIFSYLQTNEAIKLAELSTSCIVSILNPRDKKININHRWSKDSTIALKKLIYFYKKAKSGSLLERKINVPETLTYNAFSEIINLKGTTIIEKYPMHYGDKQFELVLDLPVNIIFDYIILPSKCLRVDRDKYKNFTVCKLSVKNSYDIYDILNYSKHLKVLRIETITENACMDAYNVFHKIPTLEKVYIEVEYYPLWVVDLKEREIKCNRFIECIWDVEFITSLDILEKLELKKVTVSILPGLSKEEIVEISEKWPDVIFYLFFRIDIVPGYDCDYDEYETLKALMLEKYKVLESNISHLHNIKLDLHQGLKR